MNKDEVISKTIDYFKVRIEVLEGQVLKTRIKAAKSPGSMESWSDKSKDEFTQLADGLAREVEPLRETINFLNNLKFTGKDIGAGALVLIDSGQALDRYLLMPEIGGEIIKSQGEEIFLLSAKTELGKLLLGRAEGQSISFRGNVHRIKDVQ